MARGNDSDEEIFRNILGENEHLGPVSDEIQIQKEITRLERALGKNVGEKEKFTAKQTVHKCLRCSKTFQSKWHLGRHVENIHEKSNENSGLQACSECSKVFNSVANLKRHIQNAHGHIKTLLEPSLHVSAAQNSLSIREALTGFGWLVGWFGFNGPLRQYFSLYRAVSQREGERGKKG